MENNRNIWFITLGIIGIVISIMLLVAITGDLAFLESDYRELSNSDLSFWKILKLDFPEMHNPIGPFGVFFGYWLITILGRFFGLSLLLSFALFSFFIAFMKRKKGFIPKLLSFICFSFFFNIILLILDTDVNKITGIIPGETMQFLQGIFSTTGTAIISVALILINLLYLLEVENVLKSFRIIYKILFGILLFIIKIIEGIIKIFIGIGKFILKIVAGFFRTLIVIIRYIFKIIAGIVKFIAKLFKKSDKPKKEKKPKKIKPVKEKPVKEKPIKEKPVKEKKIKKKREKKEKIKKPRKEIMPPPPIEEDSIDSDDDNIPNIIDHVSAKDKKTEYAPIIPKRKLSQNPDGIPDEPLRKYEKPSIEEFLSSVDTSHRNRAEIQREIMQTSRILEEKLAEFGVEAKVINVNIGPIITQYELEPAPGVKVSKFHSLSDDLALAIKATSIRVQAPIPGRGLVGIELPNKKRDIIYLKDILLSNQMKKMKSTLTVGLGKDIAGNPVVADLSKMPHLLIAGSTGSGKSVCVNTIIITLLMQTTPDECRILMIDPKRVELSGYEGIPHLIQNVVTDTEYALSALEWAVGEMEKRYELLQKYRVKDLKSYNQVIAKIKKTDDLLVDKHLPYIVIVVDEFADLMMTAGKDVERPITRLAQMARAIGIHLILATQRPSIKVITGVIKSNFPSRIAFKVSSKVDSRVIIDTNGADKLLGMGDMLFLPPGRGTPERIHGAFIPSEEIYNIVEYLRVQPKPENEIMIAGSEDGIIGGFEYDDELFPEAATAVVMAGSASVSMIQRHFKVGYARAGRLIDMLEQAGIVGPHVGSKSRDVLATEEDLKIYGYIKE